MSDAHLIFLHNAQPLASCFVSKKGGKSFGIYALDNTYPYPALPRAAQINRIWTCISGCFKSFPVEKDDYFIQLCKYVERNPLRAGLVQKSQGLECGYEKMELKSKKSSFLISQWKNQILI